MNLHNDLMKAKIEHDCSQCKMNCGRRIAACESFIPKNMSAFMDYYYVALINDTLSEIRRGHLAYIFSLEQLRDVMCFEPGVRVTYIPEAESYSVRLK